MSNSDSIENLVQQISQLNIMSTNLQLLKLYVDTITPYDGNPHTLNIFIENVETLIREFPSPDSQIISFIFRAIISRLSGRALSLIGARTEFKTWSEIKNALILSFGDQRNLDCLVQDLITLRPLKNESPYNFGIRCQDARSSVISKLNTSDMRPEEKMIYIKNYNDLALKTYIRGLPHFLQNNVRLRDPDSLEKAMSLVIEEENFLYSQCQSHSLIRDNTRAPERSTIQKPLTPSNPSTHNYLRPIYLPNATGSHTMPQFRSNFNIPNRYFNPNLQQSPNHGQNQPFNPQIRPNNPNHNFNSNFANKRTLSGNFRPNNNHSNRFRPQFQNQNTFSRPEPMDVDPSGTSKINPKKFRNNEFHYMQNPEEIELTDFTEEGYFENDYDPYDQIYHNEISPYECDSNYNTENQNLEDKPNAQAYSSDVTNVNFLKVQLDEEKT